MNPERQPAPVGRPDITRRAMLSGLSLAGLAVMAGGTGWVGARRGLRLFSGGRRMMGTQATILLAERDPVRADALAGAALDEMEVVARLMTRFDAGSDIGRVNRGNGEWVLVDRATGEVIEQALAVARASDGAFDPGLDQLTARWGFHDRIPPARLPDAAELAPWLGGNTHRAIDTQWREGGVRVRLAAPHVGLDLGGIAKGFAIDRAAALLRAQGIRHAIVEAGGDLYALGGHPDGEPWPIGVRDPRDTSRLHSVILARDEGVATSGDYENFFEAGGRRYAHLLEPRSASPGRNLCSLTVRAPTATLADALATAGCAREPGEGTRAALAGLLARVGAQGWLSINSAGEEWRG